MKPKNVLLAASAGWLLCTGGLVTAQSAGDYQRLKVVTKGSHGTPVKTVRGVMLDADGKPVLDVYGPDDSPAPKYRFRNRSGRAGHWEDEKGRTAETVSQRKLQAIAREKGERYHKGDWVEVTLAQVGLDERLLWPQVEPNRDSIVIVANETAPRLLPSARLRSGVTLDHGLELGTTQFQTEGGLRYLVGSVANNTQRTLANVRVTVAFSDNEDNPLGSATDSIASLEPDREFRFKLYVSREEATQYRVSATGK